MADNAPSTSSSKSRPTETESKEDAETRAARRELKQSSISDSVPTTAADTSADDTTARRATPPPDLSDAHKDSSGGEVLSPKKKRAHDQLDGDKEADDNDATSTTSADSAKDRASRLEPEKKRHRDEESGDIRLSATQSSEDASKSSQKKQQETSASAFAASGFGKLATSSSPFATLGARKGGGFGAAGAQPLTSFASATNSSDPKPAAAPKLSFGSGSGASPFAGLSSGANGFGNALNGGAFGSASSDVRPLGSFVAPDGKPLQSEKPSKPFGAPDSDIESNGEEDEGRDDSKSDEERAASPEKELEDKKKPKLHKVEVNDGETGEATIVSVRAKVFHHDKEAGWKERGSGMLKINVPQACVEFDDSGAPIPGSFDASGLELDDEESVNSGKGHKIARLILRQDQTHRVILNAAILPAMEFQEKASLKSVGILFTAFEGEEANPVNITVKMSAANAKSFMNEIGIVQRELQSS